jgi:NADH-quinone oxidoreductase subunit L
MYLNLIFLPLVGSITAGLFGRKIGPKGSVFITVTCLGIAFFNFSVYFL